MKTVLVKLKQRLSENISTRSAIENIFAFDKKNINSAIFDFDGIRLISSSAAHQFFLEIKNLEKSNIEVKCNKVDSNVQRMLDLASKDRKNIFTHQTVQHHKVNSRKELDKFLLGL